MGSDERTRELYASVESQQRRLSQALEQSGDLLSATRTRPISSRAVLEHAAAERTECGKDQAHLCGANRLCNAIGDTVKEWRSGIVAAAGALAVVAGEVALAGQDLETRYRTGPA